MKVAVFGAGAVGGHSAARGPRPRCRARRRRWSAPSTACVVHSANEVPEPGVVRNGPAENRFVIGEPDERASPRPARIVSALQAALPDVHATTEIRRVL